MPVTSESGMMISRNRGSVSRTSLMNNPGGASESAISCKSFSDSVSQMTMVSVSVTKTVTESRFFMICG